jgi:hypothetical protein
VLIDDYFPCHRIRPGNITHPPGYVPLFSQPDGRQLWVMLAEKAWAKINHTYQASEAGIMHEAFEYLLGCPSASFQTKFQTSNEIWKALKQAYDQNYHICVGTPNFDERTEAKIGIPGGHAYTLISMIEAEGKDGEIYQVLKIRNPWGQSGWTGDFSDDSPLWTKELKGKIGYTHSTDGIFCMAIQDFKKYFGVYSIAYYEENWYYEYREITSAPEKETITKFTITSQNPCKVYFRIHQQDKRSMKSNPYLKSQYQYSPAELLVGKVQTGKTISLISNKDTDPNSQAGERTIFASKDKMLILGEGTYILQTSVNWIDGKNHSYTVSAYSSQTLKFEAA